MAKKKAVKKMAVIKWNTKKVDIKLIDPTPNNYKIKTDLGRARLQTSLNKYGLAGTVVVNPNKKRYTLIDGNSRLEEAIERGEKKIDISYPTPILSPKQFKEMSAMFDFAKAGEVDMDRINKDLGTTADFYKAWGVEVPMERLDKMGARAVVETDSKVNGSNGGKQKALPEKEELQIINLFLTAKQETEFRKLEDKILAKYKLESTTDAVMKAMKAFK